MRIALTALALAGVFAAASTADQPVRGSAVAVVVSGTQGTAGEVRVDEPATNRTEVKDVDLPAIAVKQGEALVRTTRLKGGGLRAKSASVARTISLLDGVVEAYGVRRTVVEDGSQTTRSGRVEGLRIAGDSIGDVTESNSYDLPDHNGRVIVNHGTIGLRVLLEKASYGYPAGTDLRIAVVRAEVSVAAAKEVEQGRPTPTPTPKAKAKKVKKDKKKAAGKRISAQAHARLTREGYSFPVFGDASIADDFGAPRQIGAHQGNDVFAPFGAPVLAVADGVVSKVGTLPISGNRLWVTSAAGDAFFYAHLSAFSPAAVNGNEVKAGTVLGFTGNTGDAEPTPPHVHFEIHPKRGDAVDPHAILLAWQGRGDVSSSAWLQQYGTDTAERPGALVEIRDFIAGE